MKKVLGLLSSANRKHSLTKLNAQVAPKRLTALYTTPNTYVEEKKKEVRAKQRVMRQILLEKKDWYDVLCLPDGRVAAMSGIRESSRLNSFQRLHLNILSLDEKTQKARVDASLK